MAVFVELTNVMHRHKIHTDTLTTIKCCLARLLLVGPFWDFKPFTVWFRACSRDIRFFVGFYCMFSSFFFFFFLFSIEALVCVHHAVRVFYLSHIYLHSVLNQLARVSVLFIFFSFSLSIFSVLLSLFLRVFVYIRGRKSKYFQHRERITTTTTKSKQMKNV